MKISVMGTGSVGRTLSEKLVGSGYDVMMGTRDVNGKKNDDSPGRGEPSFIDWHKKNSKVAIGSYEECASFSGIIFNATNGAGSINALRLAGEKNLEGKILIDLSNPLDFSKGMPPSLLEGLNNTNSLGEEIQRTFKGLKVVKTFNTMWCGLMVNPGMIGNGKHINYISGNDADAKRRVKEILFQFGWEDQNILDLGDITAARAQEAVLPIWVRVFGTLNTGAFNFRLVK